MKKHSNRTPGRRQMLTVDYSVLTVNEPHKPLTRRIKDNAGRNSAGRITMRHQGGGHKRLYREIDFGQKIGTKGVVETIEYDPYRTAFICLVKYSDGTRRYVLAPQGITVGTEITSAENAPLKVGNRLPLKDIPVGYQVHNIELRPGQGGKLARSAGSYAEVLANADGYTDLKMSSGEIRKVLWNGYATIGQVSNAEHNLVVGGKAGRSRWLGVRPTVRGKAMNPVDHPYGGGEGDTQRGTKRPKDIWGNITGGRKTRNRRKASGKLIVSRRPKRNRK